MPVNNQLYKSIVPINNDATRTYSRERIERINAEKLYVTIGGKKVLKSSLNLNKGTLKEIPSDYVEKANKKDAVLEKIGWQNKAGKPAILQGLAKTVGASAAMATGAAYSTPAVGTLKALAKNVVAGGVGAEGFAMLEGRTATPTELAIGAGMEMVGPIVGNVPGIVKDVAQSFSKENLKTTIDNSMNYLGKVSPKLKENYVNTIKSYDDGILSADDLMSNEYFIKINDASKLSSLAEDPSIHPQKIFDAFQNSSLEESDLLHATGISIDDLKLRINEKNKLVTESPINNDGYQSGTYASQRQSGLSETEQQALNEFERTRYGTGASERVRRNMDVYDKILGDRDNISSSDIEETIRRTRERMNIHRRTNSDADIDALGLTPQQRELYQQQLDRPDLPPPPAEVHINTDGLRNHVSRFDLTHDIINNLTPERIEELRRSIMTTRPTIGNSINGMVSSLKSTPSKLGTKVGNMVNQKLRPVSNVIPLETNASRDAISIIPSLVHSGSTNGQVVKKVISSIHNMDKSPAGNYISASSLSSSSYPMTSKLLSKLDPERYKVVYDGTMGLNGMGYPERFIKNTGGTTEDIAKYINTLNKDVKVDGKTYPKAFVDQHGQLQIPKLVAKKLK